MIPLIITILLIFSNASWALTKKEYAQKLEALNLRRACNVKTAILLAKYERIQNVWLLEDKDSHLNILKNFKALKAKHPQYFKAITEFRDRYNRNDVNAGEIIKILRELHGEHTDMLKQLRAQGLVDEKFIVSINTLELKLNDFAEDVISLKTECHAGEYKGYDTLLKDINLWNKRLESLRNYVAQVGIKRSEAFHLVLEAIILKYQKRYADLTGERLKNVMNKINAILHADRVMTEMVQWFQRLSRNGIGDGALYKYLEYSRPKSLLEIYLEQCKIFEERINVLELPLETKEVLRQELNAYKTRLKQMLDRLTNSGWEGQFVKQKRRVDFLNKKLPLLAPECPVSLETYQKSIPAIKTLAQFNKKLPLFRNVIDNCKEKK